MSGLAADRPRGYLPPAQRILFAKIEDDAKKRLIAAGVKEIPIRTFQATTYVCWILGMKEMEHRAFRPAMLDCLHERRWDERFDSVCADMITHWIQYAAETSQPS